MSLHDVEKFDQPHSHENNIGREEGSLSFDDFVSDSIHVSALTALTAPSLNISEPGGKVETDASNTSARSCKGSADYVSVVSSDTDWSAEAVSRGAHELAHLGLQHFLHVDWETISCPGGDEDIDVDTLINPPADKCSDSSHDERLSSPLDKAGPLEGNGLDDLPGSLLPQLSSVSSEEEILENP